MAKSHCLAEMCSRGFTLFGGPWICAMGRFTAVPANDRIFRVL